MYLRPVGSYHHFNPLAPRGARPKRKRQPQMVADFNPLAPRGARLIDYLQILQPETFQSTRPAWGETFSCCFPCAARINFNPLAPCGARRDGAASLSQLAMISIHSPRAGRDILKRLHELCARISIHSPRAGRDLAVALRPVGEVISIHSPRAGRDWALSSCGCSSRRISIHSPRAGRDRLMEDGGLGGV